MACLWTGMLTRIVSVRIRFGFEHRFGFYLRLARHASLQGSLGNLRRELELKPLAMVLATELPVDETTGRRERNIAVAAPHEA